MMNKSDSFLESRIRWRAGLHEIATSRTMYWENAPENYRLSIAEELGLPVIVSYEDMNNFTIVCTRGLYGKNEGDEQVLLYEHIKDIAGQRLTKNAVKSETDCFKVHMDNDNNLLIKAEKGPPLFMVWNVVLMLHNLS